MSAFKRGVVKFYLLAGIVWLIVTMPTLLLSAKGNPIMAFIIAILRVLFWPVQVGRMIYLMVQTKKIEQDEEDSEDADS